MRRIRDEEKEILDRAELEVRHYATQLNIALRDGWERDAILLHKKWIARALIVLGEFEQARQMVKDEAELVRVMNEAAEMEAAVNEDDEAYCSCRHIVDLNPAESGQAKERELSSYTPTGRKTRSAKHDGKMVELYKCIHCGHSNALPAPPDEMLAKALALRSAADRAAQQAIKDGRGQRPADHLPDFTRADHLHL
jgi:hypothetical protein